MGDHDTTHAELTDCLTPRTEVFAASSGERIRKDVPGPHPITVSLESDDGTWKVVEIVSSSHACPRPPDGETDTSAENVDPDKDGSK
jgi:hypothetical protein